MNIIGVALPDCATLTPPSPSPSFNVTTMISQPHTHLMFNHLGNQHLTLSGDKHATMDWLAEPDLNPGSMIGL